MDGKVARLKGTGAVTLMWGQYSATGKAHYLILGVGVVFLDMLRYVDALQIAKVRRQMRKRLETAIRESRIETTPAFMEDLLREDPDLAPDKVQGNTAELVDLQREFRERFSWYLHQITPVTLTAAALLLVFEAAIMYELWLSSRDLTRGHPWSRSRPPHTDGATHSVRGTGLG